MTTTSKTDSNTRSKERQRSGNANERKRFTLKPSDIAFAKLIRRMEETEQTPDTTELETIEQRYREYLDSLIDALHMDGPQGFLRTKQTLLAREKRLAQILATYAAEQQGQAEPKRKKTLINLAELRKRPRPEWVIEGYIYENTIVALYAEAGCYKSFLAFDWSARIATGTNWLGHIKTNKKGAVVYIAAEGADGYIARADAWCTHNNIPFDALAENFYFWPESLPLTNNAEVARFISEVEDTLKQEEQRPQFVVIDTLLRCSNGENINSPDVMGTIFEGAARIKDALKVPNVLIVHHAGKNAQLGGMGSVVLKNNCDCLYFMSKDVTTPGQVLLKAEKMKDKPELAIYLRSEKVYYTEWMSEDEASLVLVEGEKTQEDQAYKVPDSIAALLAILDTKAEIAYSEWFDLWHEKGQRGRSKANFDKIRKKLLDNKTIEEHNGKYRRYVNPSATQSNFEREQDQEESEDSLDI